MTTAENETTLQDTIAAYLAEVAKRAPAEVLATAAEETRKLAETGILARALHVGAQAPDFTLPDARGQSVRLSEALAKGPVVVTFYRGGWCPFCDLQLRAYQSVLPQIHDLGAELIAISPQTPDFSLSDVEKKNLSFPVLSDKGNTVARSYGLVFALTEAFKTVHVAFGSVIPKFNGDDSWELPLPGTFVLDARGVVRLSFVDASYTKRLEPAAILEALRAIRG